jgi:hypothetical protein
MRNALLLLSCTVLLSCANAVVDPKQEKVDRLFRLAAFPLVEEADEVARGLRENTGVCRYLSELRTRKGLGKNWAPGNAWWEKAAATAKAERAAALKERMAKYPNVDPWYPTRKDLMKIVHRELSEAEIDRLLAQAESGPGMKYLSWQDPFIALQIIGGVVVPSECMSTLDRDARPQFIEKARARLRTLDVLPNSNQFDSLDGRLFARLLTHFLDRSFRHMGEWQNLTQRFDARIESIVAEYRAAGQP